MKKLASYAQGAWVEANGKPATLYHAVTGEPVASASSEGLDFKAIFADIVKRPYITIGMLAFLAINSTYRGPYTPGSATCLAFALAVPDDTPAMMTKLEGGIGALAPTRRHDLARLGFRAMLAGTLANFVTATIAGFLL